jgi:NAD(P)-dependent dehydrogenase (short-subunit alcohol dehydrogenase family)
MENFLINQVCLVTGGAQGIGWAIAQALADHGAQVHVCDISEENLARANEELATRPWAERIALSRCDVTERAEIEEWIKQIHWQTGRIDVLINNAAFVKWDDVTEMTVEQAIRTMEVGYNGMVYTIKAALPLMQAAGRGHIVNIGSSAGRIFASGPSAAYAAVKAAIDGYTQTLQIELKDSPVNVTLVRLAAVAGTDFFRKHVPSSRLPRIGDFFSYLTPPQVAAGVVKAIRDQRAVLDMPRYLPLLYLVFALAPGLLRRLMSVGGSGQRDYGQIEWRYSLKDGES